MISAASLIAKYDPTAVGSLLFDFSKTDQTFQESTGITLSDDAGEVVAQVYDSAQWGGKTLAELVAGQPELAYDLTNVGASVSYVGGVATFTSSPTADGVTTPANRLNAGVMHEVAFRNVSVSAGAVRPGAGALGTGLQTTAPGSYKQHLVAGGSPGTQLYARVISIGTTTAVVDNFSYKEVPGSHGVQAANLSFRPTRQAGGVLRPDGADDYFPLPYVPKLAQLYLQRINRGSNAATRILMGSTNTNRAFMGINSSNNLILGLGGTTYDTGLAVPTGDIVVAVGWDGTTKKAWVGSAPPYSAAQGADVPNTNTGIGLFANNGAGTFANFSPFDCRYAFALPALPTDAEVASLISTVGALA